MPRTCFQALPSFQNQLSRLQEADTILFISDGIKCGHSPLDLLFILLRLDVYKKTPNTDFGAIASLKE